MSWSAGGAHSLWALLGIETVCLDIFPHAETVSVCPFSLSLSLSPPCGKASASRTEDPRFDSRLRRDFFRVKSYQWLPCQAPGVIGSALGLVGPVSEYCDWVKQNVGSATSISVWQHVKLSRSIPEIH